MNAPDPQPTTGATVREEAQLAVRVRYTNWRGVEAERHVVPRRVQFGSTHWHTDDQWLMDAFDLDKGEERSFALSGFGAWPPPRSG